jgi:hypothetical protein
MATAETDNIRFAFDGEWALSRGGGIAVYPRDDGTYSIGRISGACDWRDVETGFANMQAAIDHAEWMVSA